MVKPRFEPKQFDYTKKLTLFSHLYFNFNAPSIYSSSKNWSLIHDILKSGLFRKYSKNCYEDIILFYFLMP